MSAAADQFDGWLPIGVVWRGDRPEVDWRYFGQTRLTEPFFEDTVRRVTARPFTNAFRRLTGPSALVAWAKKAPGLPPTGFIFHLSRCGSTLVAQMLAACEDSVVVSEAPPIDAILCGGHVSEAHRINWFRAMVSALGQPRGRETHFFIKFDCWHVAQLPLIASAFPDVPWVFLHRKPDQVIASHLRQRGAQTVPTLFDPKHFGLTMADALALSPAAYCAHTVDSMSTTAFNIVQQGGTIAQKGKLIDYADLPDAVFTTILPHFGVALAPSHRLAMEAVTTRHSKRPEEAYSGGM